MKLLYSHFMLPRVFSKMADDCLHHPHDLPFKHVAVLTKGKQPILEYSYNYTSNTDLSIHAEIAAIRNLFKKNGQYMKRCVL